MKCRHCAQTLQYCCLDLGCAPPSNAYLTPAQLHAPELHFPLRLYVCDVCFLVQTEDFAQREFLFDQDYAYFSSFSSSWLAHAHRYVTQMQQRFALSEESYVLEIAANDGYLLQYVQALGIPCCGIEPTASTAASARAKGLRIVEGFWGEALANTLLEEGRQADLIVANNVLAHVPDINDFVRGCASFLKPDGVATFEFPHLLNMLQLNQFDTAYHEHFSYFSLTAVKRIFEANGLTIFDVEHLPTHGGSLRVFAQRSQKPQTLWHSEQVEACLTREREAGVDRLSFYEHFQRTAEAAKNALLSYLIECHSQGLRVAAYGAAAKGNTLLNFAGIRSDLLAYVVDKNPSKQNKFLPGSRLPIVDMAHLIEDRPDRILILPWNLEQEIKQELMQVITWPVQLLTAVPTLTRV